ncbi:MAG TPA: vitamin K epoxide reductase family protein [Vicinamibacterales bacterium]|nr:vitamin K epoxide reductase family protein [Vicinamibacterales bacterium]
MSSKSRILVLAFALLGLGASAISTYVHYKLVTQPSYASFCDVNATVSCTEAYLSRYGSFVGVPVALAGVTFFAAIVVLAGLVGGPVSSSRENAPAYIFALSTIGLAFALYLGWASYVVLKVFCILCAITYVSVIAIFIISGGATTFPMMTLPRRASRDIGLLVSTPSALLVLLLLLGGSVGAVALFPREGSGPQAATTAIQEGYAPLPPDQRLKLEQWWEVQTRVDLPIDMNGARVQIVKFSDYQCPGCGAAHNSFRRVLPQYEGKGVQFLLKHYPLEPECNPNVPQGNHYAACEAAAAYVMARGNPNQQKLDDWLFANQATLTGDSVRQAAREQAGITDFDARYPAALQEVKTDASLGGLLKVASTPTVYLNGRLIAGKGAGLPPPAYIAALIDIELKRVK